MQNLTRTIAKVKTTKPALVIRTAAVTAHSARDGDEKLCTDNYFSDNICIINSNDIDLCVFKPDSGRDCQSHIGDKAAP
ncbi:MAG: hypothetical protein ACPGAC_09525, partial [Candidatus Puniceispirillaceae bacterium]